MIVLIVTYGAESPEKAQAWLAERSDEVENVLGLRRVEFIRQDQPPRAGAIMYFESLQDLQQYRESRRSEHFRESIRAGWGDESEPVREAVYRVLDVSE